MLLTIIIFVLVLSVLVFAHEFGHFYTARRFGVKAEEFGFGFPPRAIGWFKGRSGKWRKVLGNTSIEALENNPEESRRPAHGSTIYSLNWLPIGGFVKIKGENGDGVDEKDSFAAQAIWRRIVILAAGVIMNIVLAWFLLSLGYMFGMPQSTEDLGSQARVSSQEVSIVQVMPGSVAAQAGLKEGDAILRIDNTAVGTEKSLQDAVAAGANREIEISFKRNGQEQTVKAMPVSKDGARATVGVVIVSSGLVSYPVHVSLWEGAKTTGWILKEIFKAFYELFSSIFKGHDVSGQFAGPVGIANITGQAARLGFTHLLQFIALLSLNLAVLNILPFPALDGGRILFLLIEKLKGRPVRKEVEGLIHNIGFLLLIALVVFITYKDIIKFF